MKRSVIECDFCNKEVKPEEFHEYSIIKRGFFLAKTEAILDICDDCMEHFIQNATKKRRNKK